MKWSVVDCEWCGGVVLVPIDCAERVERGVATVVCGKCIENVERVK